MNPELADRLQALEAERVRPVPPPPPDPLLQPITPARAAFNRSRLETALRTAYPAERVQANRSALEVARRILRQQYEADLEEYRWLRATYGYNAAQAAEHMELSWVQARSYERHYRDGAAA